MSIDRRYVIAILGGTGNEGTGIALRLAKAGHQVVLGSRDPEKASRVAADLNAILGSDSVQGAGNRTAAARAEIAVLTVPYAAQMETVRQVADLLPGKILVDATAPLVPPKVGHVQLPENGSAVAAVQRELGPRVQVVSAFQNVSAQHLKDLDHPVDCDVIICGNDASACEIVRKLVADMGLRGFHAGPICNSAAAEALTSILISINGRYKVRGAGIRITGIPQA